MAAFGKNPLLLPISTFDSIWPPKKCRFCEFYLKFWYNYFWAWLIHSWNPFLKILHHSTYEVNVDYSNFTCNGVLVKFEVYWRRPYPWDFLIKIFSCVRRRPRHITETEDSVSSKNATHYLHCDSVCTVAPSCWKKGPIKTVYSTSNCDLWSVKWALIKFTGIFYCSLWTVLLIRVIDIDLTERVMRNLQERLQHCIAETDVIYLMSFSEYNFCIIPLLDYLIVIKLLSFVIYFLS